MSQYSRKNIYKFSRFGTNTEAFAKNVFNSESEFELTEKTKEIDELTWSNSNFNIKKNQLNLLNV